MESYFAEILVWGVRNYCGPMRSDTYDVPHFLETSLACGSIRSNLDWVIPKSALAARITRFGPHASTAHRRERCRPSGGPKSGQVVPEAVSTPNPVRLFRGA